MQMRESQTERQNRIGVASEASVEGAQISLFYWKRKQPPQLRVIDRMLELRSEREHEGCRACSARNYKLSIHDFCWYRASTRIKSFRMLYKHPFLDRGSRKLTMEIGAHQHG